MDVTFKSDENYDIGDYVGTKEYYTGIQIREEITKKDCKSQQKRHQRRVPDWRIGA